MDHAWCRDVARDAAVRAAEDGRDRPLPTLGEAIAAITNHDAPPGASGGGEGEPVAWMCEWTDHTGLYLSRRGAEAEADGDVVPQPLYRQPPQPRGWLTGEERLALDAARTIIDGSERTSELPSTPFSPARRRRRLRCLWQIVRGAAITPRFGESAWTLSACRSPRRAWR